MDVNGTRFHLLLGKADWGACLDAGMRRTLAESWPTGTTNEANVEWNPERKELTLERRLFKFVAAKNDRPPRLSDRRGAARDTFGNWYWIADSQSEILVNSSGAGLTSHFWSAKDLAGCEREESAGGFRPRTPESAPRSLNLSGLAVTEDHYLVVGVVEPPGLLIFDLHAGGAPRRMCWPRGVDFAPFDMTAAPTGGVFILDRAHRRFWSLDRRFNVIEPAPAEESSAPDDFQPTDGGEPRQTRARAFPEGISLDSSSPIAGGDPVAIEALPDSTVLILFGVSGAGERFSAIRRYRLGGQLGADLSTAEITDRIEGDPQSARLVGHDFAFVPEKTKREDKLTGVLYVAGETGNQSFAFNVYERAEDKLELEASPDYLPMRLFGGKALVAAAGKVYYDFGQRFVPLVNQRRPLYELEATFHTPLNTRAAHDPEDQPSTDGEAATARDAFDGREPDCVWHRLLMDGCIPPEAQVEVWSRAANDRRELSLAPWRREPRPILRADGSELPFTPDRTDEARGAGTWELLFQNARGRYLQLRLRLSGNGRSSPRLRALRAYYPRFSYLSNYLPAVYRENDESASFLDRFLSNVEGIYTTIEDRIAAAQVLFDTRSAPAETLDWLASWFGVALDPAWDDARRRLFITYAMEFFRWRGTTRGLKTALRLAFDEHVDEKLFDTRAQGGVCAERIRIVEKFRARGKPGVLFGDPTDLGERDGLGATRWLVAAPPSTKGASVAQIGGGSAGFTQHPFGCGCHGGASKVKAAVGAETKSAEKKQEEEVKKAVPPAVAAERAAWQEYLRSVYGKDVGALNKTYKLTGAERFEKFSDVPLPSGRPADTAHAKDWREWAAKSSARSTERRLWQEFLAARYGNVKLLNAAYKMSWDSFETVSLPGETPEGGAARRDWYDFTNVLLPMRDAAHRFTVLLPATKEHLTDSREHVRQRDLAERIVRLEKPAHTVFDVKFYWAFFRVGEARLGLDTLAHLGSRAPQLMPPVVLGQNYLAESHLAPSHPQDVADRMVVGRDAVRARDPETRRLNLIG